MRNQKHFIRRLRSQMKRNSIATLTLLITGGCVAPTADQGLTEAPLRWVSKVPFFGDRAVEKSDPATPPSMIPPTSVHSTSKFKLAAHRTQTEAEDLSLSTDTLALGDDQIEALPPPAGFSDTEISSVIPESAVPTEFSGNAYIAEPQVIDLASSLGMAGGNAWTIQLARQRTVEAHADLTSAKALWLPSLQLGIGWNNHSGRIQATDGQVIEAARSSLFVGGGATFGEAPIAGGSGGPLRLSADLAIADAFFGQKIASRTVAARRYGVSVAQNQAVLAAGLAYIDLLEAAATQADAQAAIESAGELLQLTQAFQEAGAGAQADVDRAATEQARLRQQVQDAQRRLRTSSATLARRLRLDARTTLIPADPKMMPLDLASEIGDLNTLIGTSLYQRPELAAQSQQIAALCLEVKKADIEPWIPQVAMTTSVGTFGGSTSSEINSSGSRSDVDLQALWELDSLGVGVRAKRQRAGSRLSQGRTQLADLRDEISAEVVRAYEDVINYRSQIGSADSALSLAETSYQRNLERIRADEGLPIELLQAIGARAASLSQRTTAVAAYNRAQLQLLYATGQLSQ